MLVCIKLSQQTGEIGRFDAIALEEALRLKEVSMDEESTRVDVVTLGADSDDTILRRALGMGAQNAARICSEDNVYLSSIKTAAILAAMAELHEYDLILTGVMSEDMMAGQVGPMMARMLNLPCAAGVVKLDRSGRADCFQVEREMENGCRDCLEIQMPCVLTVQAGVNPPRYPSLSRMLAAKSKMIMVYSQTQLLEKVKIPGLPFLGIEKTGRTRKGEWLKGDVQAKADSFLFFLRNKGVV